MYFTFTIKEDEWNFYINKDEFERTCNKKPRYMNDLFSELTITRCRIWKIGRKLMRPNSITMITSAGEGLWGKIKED